MLGEKPWDTILLGFDYTDKPKSASAAIPTSTTGVHAAILPTDPLDIQLKSRTQEEKYGNGKPRRVFIVGDIKSD